MTQNERMKIFKKAWKASILTSVYPVNPSGNPMGSMAFLKSISEQLFPENNLSFKLDINNLEKFIGDQSTIKHEAKNVLGNDTVNFSSANDIKESEPGSHFMFLHGENSRLLKKTGTRLNVGLYLGNGYFMENSIGSSFTWDEYKFDNEFEPRLLLWFKWSYNPTIYVDDIYFRPNNLGDNNDEVVWRDFWDSICP